jgi:O-acetyl-ADP-ribose deacetylase (regulator of RNase III)
MALIRVKGDILEMAEGGQFNVIVQGCNCFNTMGSGLAKKIKDRYPEVYEADCRTVKGDRNKLGKATSAWVARSIFEPEQGFTVVNAYTQYDYNVAGERWKDRFEYEAFASFLVSLAGSILTIRSNSDRLDQLRIGFPMIGMGRAGGDPQRIIPMLEEFSAAVELLDGTVTLVEFEEA